MCYRTSCCRGQSLKSLLFSRNKGNAGVPLEKYGRVKTICSIRVDGLQCASYIIAMTSDYLLLSDDKIFYTLEGESKFVGQCSVFMRLFGCNLTCRGWATPDSPNGCDSYISWSVKNKMTFDEIFELLDADEPGSYGSMVDRLRRGAIFKITGGEPMLRQEPLIRFIKAFQSRYQFLPHIDFETNATIMPDPYWTDIGATFTTSPKLTTNGDPEEKTYVPEVLAWHSKAGSVFKFVIADSSDVDEVWRKYVEDDNNINVSRHQIWFMPCCGSRSEHEVVAPIVAEFAKAMNVNFSPRLHLVLWNKALRV